MKCMAPVKNRAVFTESLLPEGQRRWGSFSAGIGLECVALLALIVIPLFMPQKFQAVEHDWVTPIEAPVIQAWKPQPPPKPVAVKREIVKEIPKPVEVVTPKPQIFNPVITAPVAKRVVERKTAAPEVVAKAFPDPNPPLSMGSSAIPTLRKPREAVQTGGFGDPNGVPTNGKTDHNVNIAQLGSFRHACGPGKWQRHRRRERREGCREQRGIWQWRSCWRTRRREPRHRSPGPFRRRASRSRRVRR